MVEGLGTEKAGVSQGGERGKKNQVTMEEDNLI